MINGNLGVSENVVYPIVPNGFADHYPVFKLLFPWGVTPFSDIPILCHSLGIGQVISYPKN